MGTASKYCLDHLVPYSEMETTVEKQKTRSYHLKLTLHLKCSQSFMNIINEIIIALALNVAIRSLDMVQWKFLLRVLGESSLVPLHEAPPHLEH